MALFLAGNKDADKLLKKYSKKLNFREADMEYECKNISEFIECVTILLAQYLRIYLKTRQNKVFGPGY